MTARIADVSDLASRLPFVLDTDETREATGALDDLSDEARYYGSEKWEKETAPYAVKNLILKAAARHMKNYEGYINSKAGDESVTWADRPELGTASFNTQERERLASLAGRYDPDFFSVGMFAYQTQRYERQEGLVPDAASNEPIHFFSSDTEPW